MSLTDVKTPYCMVFIACSLDGYIARPDGSIDWLEEANASVPAGEDCGYAALIERTDAIVMGRNTFEKVMTFTSWPYASVPVVVLSRSLVRLPENAPATVSLWRDEISALVEHLSDAGKSRIYVDGGKTIQSFLREDRVDEMTITTIPILLGRGIRLFEAMETSMPMTLSHSRSFEFGFVQSTYYIHSRHKQ